MNWSYSPTILFVITGIALGDPALDQAKKTYETKLADLEANHIKAVEKLKTDLLNEYAKAIERARHDSAKSTELITEKAKIEKEIESVKTGWNPRINYDSFPLVVRTARSKCAEVDEVSLNSNPKGLPVVTAEGQPCKYIYAHANSKIEFDIPAGVVKFKSQGTSLSGKKLEFSVIIDGAVKYRSGPLENIAGGYAHIEVDIPPDSKTITLAVDPLKSNTGDYSVWIDPTLYK